MAVPSWMAGAGLTDAASSLAYSQLLGAMTGEGGMDPRQTARLRLMRDRDLSMQGGTVAPGADKTSYDQRAAGLRTMSEDAMAAEGRDRKMDDLGLYGQTFQKASIADYNFRQDVNNSAKAMKRLKRQNRKKKYGTILKTVGSVVSAFNPIVGGALMAVGTGVAGSGNAKVDIPKSNRATGADVAGEKAKETDVQLAPVKSGVKPDPLLTDIDPLTGRPRVVRSGQAY